MADLGMLVQRYFEFASTINPIVVLCRRRPELIGKLSFQISIGSLTVNTLSTITRILSGNTTNRSGAER